MSYPPHSKTCVEGYLKFAFCQALKRAHIILFETVRLDQNKYITGFSLSVMLSDHSSITALSLLFSYSSITW